MPLWFTSPHQSCGVELTPDVADGAHSAILHQVNNGGAVLWLVTGV